LFLKLVSGQYVAQSFYICLPVMFNVIALPSFIHTFSYVFFIHGITEITTNTKYTAAMVPDCRTVTLISVLLIIMDEFVYYMRDLATNYY
jgi:uncharacterized membrane protein